MESVVNGASTFTTVISKIGDILNAIINLPKILIDGIGEFFKTLWSWLEYILNVIRNILSYLNPFSENFFGYKLIELLGDLLKSLFVPSDDRINGVINVVKNKFNFVYSIIDGANAMKDIINNVGNSPKLTINVSKTKYTESQNLTILDLSFYAPYKQYGDLILTGFIYVMFLWRLFISLPNIINGVGGVIQGDLMMQDIQTYNNFGFGRSFGLTSYQNKNGGIFRK